ncbi:hypothetical protein JZO67_000209 [Enterococcus sp. 665A]|uniref:Uncharacterized protein n=1 Tax=Candidatus Enterococcus ferrettii TaxID=2815324 RepID=A0ABV0EKM7_9ENTE
MDYFKKTINKIKRKVSKCFNVFFVPSLLIFALIEILLGSWERALHFIVLYTVCFLGDRLLDIKKSLDTIWYLLYKRNKKDGID